MKTILAGILLGLAVLVTLLSVVGALVVRTPYQKLHFVAPPAMVSAVLIVAAVWVDEPQAQAGMKATFVALVLLLSNSVVSHATARAARIRSHATWKPRQGEQVILVDEQGRPIGTAECSDEVE